MDFFNSLPKMEHTPLKSLNRIQCNLQTFFHKMLTLCTDFLYGFQGRKTGISPTEPCSQFFQFRLFFSEFVDSIRDKLFYLSQPPGNDLVSLNIQRGRDQGTPSYNKWREFCGLRNYTTFSEFGYLGYKLARLYKYVLLFQCFYFIYNVIN